MESSGDPNDPSRLGARPEPGPRGELSAGLQPLGLSPRRDGLLYVPASYRRDRPAPLVVLLHGAGGNAHHGLALLKELADEAGLLLLALDSRHATWDIIADDTYGPDVTFLDRALRQLFRDAAVDPARLAIGGFSDGASYALSLGLTNGDLFTHVIAFSPGFMAPAAQRGRPRVFVSHGTQDQVLRIDPCSRRLTPLLRRAGYDLRYQEFEGPHVVPPEIARDALEWFLPRAT
ncbi:phospholipase [Sorangium cellulosum]|uniref:Phospholipase n=1 Tax=Sorangium cellulosum TaxID=56 RepID=A0A2L0F3L0_SORCE|nr:phospholipase [Sorangium cellulosum]AUX46039.1 phospholipase [Sorangium cellulosum]